MQIYTNTWDFSSTVHIFAALKVRFSFATSCLYTFTICIIITYLYLLIKKQIFLYCLFFILLALVIFCDLTPLATAAYATNPVLHLESNFARLIFLCGCQCGYSAEETHYRQCVPLCVVVRISLSFEISLHYPLLNNALYTVVKYSDGGSAL